jgi:kinesin family protein 5
LLVVYQLNKVVDSLIFSNLNVKQFFLFVHRWRAGQTVSADEQLNFTEMEESMTASVALNNPVAFDRPTAQLSLSSSHISLEDRKNLEEEREKLFQLLDAKDDEIQEQSQLVEKLKEQMLEQEELIVGTRRDYENLSKEMNKIQVSLSYSIGLNPK